MDNIKIMFSILDEPILIKNLTSIVIENKSIFARIVKDIYDYENGNQNDIRIFKQDQSSLLPSEILPITDIVGFDINSTSTLKAIYKDLEDIISIEPDKKTKIEDLLGEIWSIIGKEIIHFELNLNMQKITIQSIFKVLCIKIDCDCPSIFEKTMTIFRGF